jgi:predicted TIM-barrel fold metal-dependent hydrolase
VLFGSDWPHPEGLKDPITFVDELTDFDEKDIAKIMGGNLMKLMKVSKPAKKPVSA